MLSLPTVRAVITQAQGEFGSAEFTPSRIRSRTEDAAAGR